MNLKYRACACVLLAATAAFCAAFTVRDLRGGHPAHAAPAPVTEQTPETGFTLCAKNGCVAVLDPALGAGAVVTDIELSTLRESDRQLIETGMHVDTREELLTLLEDLGS